MLQDLKASEVSTGIGTKWTVGPVEIPVSGIYVKEIIRTSNCSITFESEKSEKP